MKLAISGKGGVGKSTLAAGLASLLAQKGEKVLAVDADPDANLAAALGISPAVQSAIVPISKRRALIEERTGAKVKQYGQMFKLNPQVSDIAEKFAYAHQGVSLLILGAIESGGSGCACPESVLLRALVQDLVLHKHESLILDMEAGVEHLGRATARGVDRMVVVVEPGRRAIDSAYRIARMASEIGLKQIAVVGNKVSSPADESFIRSSLPEFEILGMIPYVERLRSADQEGKSVWDALDGEVQQRFRAILDNLQSF